MEQDLYPLGYRAAEVQQVMSWIRAGQSGCIVGLRESGKSYFVHFLLGEEVRQHYLGPDYGQFLFVLIDLLALTGYTEWATCELILDRLLGQACPPVIEPAIAAEMTSLHQEAMRVRDLFTAERALERCLDALCRRPTQRVVMLLSKFDAVFQTLDPPLFRCLRSIYEAHKGQVSYVVVVANELTCLRSDLATVDPFYRLVSRNICYLGPFCEADARHMIRYEAALRSTDLSADDIARLVELSGGHAGTIKAILSLLWDPHRGGGLAELAPLLKDELAVQAESRKVWDNLSEDEQAALCALSAGAQVDPGMLRRLKHTGVVQESQSGPRPFSPLFADFVRRQASPSLRGTVISRSPPLVRFGGRHIESLTELELETLCYLYENRGRVCTKDDLAENVYRQQYDRMAGGVTDEALQALISRLRDKIEPDRTRPRYIVTVRGEGYKFVEKHDGE